MAFVGTYGFAAVMARHRWPRACAVGRDGVLVRPPHRPAHVRCAIGWVGYEPARLSHLFRRQAVGRCAGELRKPQSCASDRPNKIQAHFSATRTNEYFRNRAYDTRAEG